MAEHVYDVYAQIVSATYSDLVLFFIILAVAIAPLYALVLKGRKTELELRHKREQDFLDVIREHTRVMASLKTTLDKDTGSTSNALERVHCRVDDIANDTSKILAYHEVKELCDEKG